MSEKIYRKNWLQEMTNYGQKLTEPVQQAMQSDVAQAINRAMYLDDQIAEAAGAADRVDESQRQAIEQLSRNAELTDTIEQLVRDARNHPEWQ